jgi:tetratricopeptide (TPR) repeat protein
LARAYSGNKQFDEAVAEYEQLIQAAGFEDTQRGDMIFTIAGIQRQRKDYGAAVATLGRVKGMKLPADRQFEPRAMAEIAAVHFAAGKDADGMEQLRKLKELCQSNKQYARCGYFRQAYTMTAEQLRKQGKFPDAIKEYRQSLQIKGLEDGCYASDEAAMAECYLAIKDTPAAAEHFRAAASQYPKADRDVRIRACLRGGDCLRDLGRKGAAASLYQQVLDMPDAAPEHQKTARQRLEQVK